MTETQKLSTCLWFNDNAEEAAAFYISAFKSSKTKGVTRYGESASEASGRPKGSVMTVHFELDGYEMLALNGGPHFQPTPAISFFVTCETEKEIDDLWGKLSAGGKALMGLDKYPFAKKYGWCSDKFGFSWQLMLTDKKEKIKPALLFTGGNNGRAEEAMKLYTSLFGDSKIDSIARDEKTGVVLHARFTLAGQGFVAMESPLNHEFGFNQAVSLWVNCEDQREIDGLWAALSASEEAEACGWLMDKFGVSWQIVPSSLGRWLLDRDPIKVDRLMKAVTRMKKLDIRALEEAARG